VFRDPSQEFVYKRTYARWLDNQKRRENWEETVERYVEFIETERGGSIPSKVIKKTKQYMLKLEVMPSMRMAWTAGEAAKRDNTCIYNCAFSAVDSIQAFSECLFILMCGTGFGFSVENKYINKLPKVKQLSSLGAGTYQIPDSKEGWADSVKMLLENLYNGKDIQFDYSKLRKKGSNLKTMGGKSSGSGPLIALHHFIREVFSKAQGRKLTSLECHDIMNQIAEIVVCGGVRRSSQISLSDLDDLEMRNCKTGNFPLRRYMANNSAVYTKKPTAVEFLNEWAALANSGTGERGIFNLYAAQANAPERRKSELIQGVNPCFSGDMYLKTTEGFEKFKDLSGKAIKIINKNNEIVEGNVWQTGIKKVIEIKNTLGEKIKCTPDHIFQLNNGESCQAIDLKNKRLMPFFILNNEINLFTKLGFIQGDGNLTRLNSKDHKGLEVNIGKDDIDIAKIFNIEYNKNKRSYYINEFNDICREKQFEARALPERKLPRTYIQWDQEQKSSFLKGLYSANGSIIKNKRIAFKTICKELAYQLKQSLWEDFNIDSYITTNKAKKVKFDNGTYECKESYDLNISKYYDIIKFAECISFVHEYKIKKLSELIINKSPMINKVTELNKEMVYDFTLFDNIHWGIISDSPYGNGYIAHNCGEISLRDKEFCNLTEVVVKADDDLDDLMKKVECAVWIGVIQSTFTKFTYLRRKWKKNCEEERLIGVSLTGQMDNPKLMTPDNLLALKKKAIKISKKAAKIMGINEPVATTTGKPSGTVSQLCNCASGCHPRYAPYYIRRYRISATDSLFKLLKDSNFPMCPEVGQGKEDIKNWSEDKVNTWVVEFPIKSPKGSITRHNISAIQQLEHYKVIQENWCEHNQSITVYVKDEEWFEVGNWVYKNWDIVNGVSFLPYDGGKYKLAPYEEISKEKYQELIKLLPEIDYSKLSKYEVEDNTEGAKSYACVGDRCELK
jgi:ribonucleotide reductase class II